MTWLDEVNSSLIKHRYNPIDDAMLEKIAKSAADYMREGADAREAWRIALFDHNYGIVADDVVIHDENGRWVPSSPAITPPPDLEDDA